MKTIIHVFIFSLFAIVQGVAQEKDQNNNHRFFLDATNVKVLDYESDFTGSTFVYVFEDHYGVKITNKKYRIKLNFKNENFETLKKSIVDHFDSDHTWTKLKNGNPMYKIDLDEDTLSIKVNKKFMNTEAYQEVTSLGQILLNIINS